MHAFLCTRNSNERLRGSWNEFTTATSSPHHSSHLAQPLQQLRQWVKSAAGTTALESARARITAINTTATTATSNDTTAIGTAVSGTSEAQS